MYTLGWNQPGRRAGLTRDGYKAPSLLQTISSPNNKKATMRPTVENLSDDEIYASPKDDSSSSSDGENACRAADIKPTQFIKRGSEEPKPKSNQVSQRKRKHTPDQNTATSTAKNTRSSRQSAPKPSLSRSSDLSKRNKSADDIKFGTGLADEFGRVELKKIKSGKTYGSGRQNVNPNRSQTKSLKGTSLVCLLRLALF